VGAGPWGAEDGLSDAYPLQTLRNRHSEEFTPDLYPCLRTRSGTASEVKNRMEVVARSSADRAADVRPKSRQKSRITNGTALLSGVDGRSPWVRRCKDIISEAIADLGGFDNTSAAERSIVRRAATLSVELERMERQFALAGEADPDDLDAYQRCANSLRRLLEAVGLQRRARDVGPSLGDILRQGIEEQRQP
jgi:hypothetical protein